MAWITTVENRTSAVAYNSTDLNRVGENNQYLADLLNLYGYLVAVQTKTDWAIEDIPKQSDMVKYLSDLQALKNAYYSETAIPATMSRLNFVSANNIEKLLSEIKLSVENMTANYNFLGDIFLGEIQ